MTKGDINDYSRFESIVDSDSDDNENTVDTKETKKLDTTKCAACFTSGMKLKPCSRCKKKNYCNTACQKNDWKFHKRICVKPEDKKKPKEEVKKKEKNKVSTIQPSSSSNTKSTTATTPTTTTSATTTLSPSSSTKPPILNVDDEVHDEEDKAALKEISKGYRYFSRTPTDTEKTLIGDITPKRLESANVATSSSNDDIAVTIAATKTAGSTWNKAGTWEDKDKLDWAKTAITDLLKPLSCDLGIGKVSCTGVSDFKGNATVSIIRNKECRLFDISFTVTLELTFTSSPGGIANTYIGSLQYTDVSNDCGDLDYNETIIWDKTTKGPVLVGNISDSVEKFKKMVQDSLLAFKDTFLSVRF